MMDPMAGGGTMMPGSYNQGYQGAPQASTMMSGGMPPQSGFMPGQASGQVTSQYTSNPQRMSAGMGGMAPAGNTSMNSYNQRPMAPSGGPGQHQQSYMVTPMANSQQQMLRQQMMAMQQQ